MRTTTKQYIIYYLQTHRSWISGSELERQASNWFTKASVISRRCRELVESGAIERQLNGKTVAYRLKPPVVGTSKPQPQKEQLFDTDNLIRRKVIY